MKHFYYGKKEQYITRDKKIKNNLSFEKIHESYKNIEKFVINKLKLIKNGNLKLINYDGKVYHFGD